MFGIIRKNNPKLMYIVIKKAFDYNVTTIVFCKKCKEQVETGGTTL